MAFRPKKRLGQNFLHDPGIARKMVGAANLRPGQTVIELGAGRGFLTRPLAALGVRLIAFELDRDLYRDLAPDFQAGSTDQGADHSNVEILNQDFTRVSLTSLLAERGHAGCVLIGSIPYHLTRNVLFSFLVDESEVIESAYLMLQREVGERIAASPGSKTYGIPSVVLQSLYSVRSLFRVVAGSFTPRPKVDSLVVGFEPLATPMMEPSELRPFVSLVKNLFQQRRKTIHNTLRSAYTLSPAELGHIHHSTGVDLEARPEALSVKEFLALSRTVTDVIPGKQKAGL